MNRRSQVGLRLVAGFAMLGLAYGCQSNPPPPATPTAVTAAPKIVKETDLAVLTLSADEADSLRIRSAPVRRPEVREHAARAGWLIAPPGKEVTLTAPVSGYLRAASPPIAGMPVKLEQELFSLRPILSPLEQVQLAALRRGVISEQIKAEQNVAVAKTELKRIHDLKALRTQQELEEAQAQARLKSAEEDLKAAKDKLALFDAAAGDSQELLKTLAIVAPHEGTILTVHASPGQYVPAAAPLVTITEMSRPWIRVPVLEEEFASVQFDEATAHIKERWGSAPATSPYFATKASFKYPVPLVDRSRHVELLYELLVAPRIFPQSDPVRLPAEEWPGPYAKDQMVTVFIPLSGLRTQTVVPAAAIAHDNTGGAWVYLDRTPAGAKSRTYERRRVEVGPRVKLADKTYEDVNEGLIVKLDAGPEDRVVTRSAQALFSREFYRPPTPAKKDAPEDDD